MNNYCKLNYSGSEKAPYNWITSTNIGINRLIYVNGGEGGYLKDGIKIPFKKDCLYLIPASAHFIPTYTSYASDEARLDHTYANFEIVPPIISKDVLCLDSFDDDETRAVVEAFKVFCIQSAKEKGFDKLDNASQAFLKATIVFLVDKIAQKSNLETVKDEVILNALTIMHEKLDQKLTIADIASLCYLSPNGFIRRFKRVVGETPYSYLKKLKIRTAQNMRMSGITLQEIAEKCGYSDSSSLLHAIEKKTEPIA